MKQLAREKTRLTVKERHFIENQNHCALCNSVLQIDIKRDQFEAVLVEEASCLKCKIKTRVKNHGLH